MKSSFQLFITALLLISFTSILHAQTPEGINYQAVARDGNGQIMESKSISVRFSILSGSSASNLVYQETHSVSTNDYGLFSVVIGAGAANVGAFSDVDWPNNEHHLKVEVDGGSGFVNMGTQQLYSVPYAQSAKTAENFPSLAINDLDDVNTNGVSNGQVLKYNGAVWAPATDNTGGGGSSVWTQSGNNIYYNTGNVGIGTSTPNNLLDVKYTLGSNTNAAIELDVTGSSGNLSRGMFSTLDGQGGVDNYGIDATVTGSTSGVGSAIGVNSIADSDGENNFGVWAEAGADASTRNYGLYGQTLGTGTFNIGAAGFSSVSGSQTNYGVLGLAINSSSDNYGVYSDGDLVYTGSLYQGSDARFKENVTNLESSLDKIMQLRPTSYYFKKPEEANISLSKGMQYGFIAQELEQVFPHMVKEIKHPNNAQVGSEMKDDFYLFKGVNYTQLIPVLVQSVQEQQKMISDLQQQLSDMQAELDELKNK